MAIRQYRPYLAQCFIGLAADTKPTLGTGLGGAQPGDKFIEEDTGKTYILGPSGTWRQLGTITAAAAGGPSIVV